MQNTTIAPPASFKDRLLANENVRAAWTNARQAQSAYQEQLEKMFLLLYPATHVEKLKAAMSHMTDAAEVSACRDEINTWSNPATKAAARQAEIIARGHAQEFSKSIPPLLDCAERVISEFEVEADSAEKDFHAKFALPAERTAVSRSLEAFRKHLAHFRQKLVPQQQIYGAPSKNLHDEILNYFGETGSLE